MKNTSLPLAGFEMAPTFRASPFLFGVTGPGRSGAVNATRTITFTEEWADAALISSATITFSVDPDGVVWEDGDEADDARSSGLGSHIIRGFRMGPSV